MTRSLDSLTSWHADWSGLRVFVVGLGVSGFAVADTLWELGAVVHVASDRPSPDHEAMLDVLGVEHVITDSPETCETSAAEFAPDIVVVSPGISPRHRILDWAARSDIPVWSDIELAWRVRDKVTVAPWIVITGTNGKTTTTQLTAHFLRSAGLRAIECGNIGVPVLDAVRNPEGFDYLVVELSSFQLHWLPSSGAGALHPYSSTCLNVAEDHVDWHGSADAYRQAKASVYTNTQVACVYSTVDHITETMVEDADVQEGCRAIGFGFMVPGPSGFGTIEGILVDRAFVENRHESAQELTTIDRLAELGMAQPHMILNILAAAALARSTGISPEAVSRGIDSFVVDHHRCEVVAEAGGVTWVDDSKATNAHAANASLRAFPSIVWIVGGLFKGTQIDEIVQAHASRLRGVVIIGEDRAEPIRALTAHAPHVPWKQISGGDVMAQAVAAARDFARDGDTVLLAPAAASMDQFVDYADRGRKFASAVAELIAEQS